MDPLLIDEPLYATIRRQGGRRSSLEPMLPPPPPPEFNDTDATDLEAKYGGRIIANTAAVILQRAYRTYRLSKQFKQLLSLAQTNETLDRRLSTLEEEQPRPLLTFRNQMQVST